MKNVPSRKHGTKVLKKVKVRALKIWAKNECYRLNNKVGEAWGV